MWEVSRAEVVLEAEGMQLSMTYIGKQQATVAQWVALQPIFEVCAEEKGYEGGKHRREAWWRQEAIEKQLRSTLAGILQEAKRRRLVGETTTR